MVAQTRNRAQQVTQATGKAVKGAKRAVASVSGKTPQQVSKRAKVRRRMISAACGEPLRSKSCDGCATTCRKPLQPVPEWLALRPWRALGWAQPSLRVSAAPLPSVGAATRLPRRPGRATGVRRRHSRRPRYECLSAP